MQSTQPRTIYIYGLCDPRSAEIRYVGQTNDLIRRYRHHVSPPASARTSHKAQWVRSLARVGLVPRLLVIEVAPTDPDIAETWWITFLRREGYRLTNHTDGGHGCYGRHQTDDAKRRISEAHRGVPLSAEHRARIAASGVGRTTTAETRLKLSLGKRGVKKSPKQVEKMRLAKLGFRHSDETKQKLSVLWKGKKRSPEQRREMAERATGSRSPVAKLTEATALEILQRRRAGETGASLAREFGVSDAAVSLIYLRQNWKHIE